MSDSQKPSDNLSSLQGRVQQERLKIRDFYEKSRDELKLHPLTPLDDTDRDIGTTDISRPSFVLMGYDAHFPKDRIQILGKAEVSYLKTLSREESRKALANLCRFDIPCIILSRSLDPPDDLLELATANKIPVLQSELPTTDFIQVVASILNEQFSPFTSVHGTLVDVYGVGLLFTGRSGIGKSECGLDLVERGHRLVADDVVHVKERHKSVLIGRGVELARSFMEIRGIGIIDVQAMYGIRSIRAQKRIELQVVLKEWEAAKDFERLGLEEKETMILGVKIPMVIVPIIPGKNISVIAETIALNYLVKAYGYNPAEHFSDNLLEVLRRKANLERLARDDPE